MLIIFVPLHCDINIINNKNKNFMRKAFNFIESLKQPFFDLMGYPRIKFYKDFVEVYFDCNSTIRSLDILNDISGYDEFRFFSGIDCITFAYTFYKEND